MRTSKGIVIATRKVSWRYYIYDFSRNKFLTERSDTGFQSIKVFTDEILRELKSDEQLIKTLNVYGIYIIPYLLLAHHRNLLIRDMADVDSRDDLIKFQEIVREVNDTDLVKRILPKSFYPWQVV